MKFLIPLFVAFVVSLPNQAEAKQWVLLVAGARTYDNYRHQANICHAYHIMLSRGISRRNIITMLYDDVAYNSRNPFPGNIINEYNGPNVYAGMRIDYKGKDVTQKNFLKILQGEEMDVGSGRTMETNEGDTIFVYYSDHGNNDILAFPYGSVLRARDLNAAIVSMHEKKRYSKMVIYVEACHSGSMFQDRLPKDINVYVMTAASPTESSYSCCYDRQRRTPLGDIFSGSWMRDLERLLPEETLEEQYKRTKRETTMSHVQVYGDYNGMKGLKVADFTGDKLSGTPRMSSSSCPTGIVMSQWDVPFVSLLHQLEDSNTTQGRLEVIKELLEQQEAYLAIHKNLEDIINKVTGESDPQPLFQQMRQSKTTVDQDDCYESSVNAYLEICTKYQDYTYFMKDVYVFKNLCTQGKSPAAIRDAVVAVCGEK